MVRSKKSKEEGVKGNPIHRRLKFHEKKLLKKHDFMQYPQDMWHETYCVQRYHLQDREDYRRYLKLQALIKALMSHMRYLPSSSKVRIQITEQLCSKLYDAGLTTSRQGLAEVDKLGVEPFCQRRLASVLVKLNMAKGCREASEYIAHGHVRVGLQQVTDPAFLVPRGMEDTITWMDDSRIKRHIKRFERKFDDYEA